MTNITGSKGRRGSSIIGGIQNKDNNIIDVL
jgi:hypothetical protein